MNATLPMLLSYITVAGIAMFFTMQWERNRRLKHARIKMDRVRQLLAQLRQGTTSSQENWQELVVMTQGKGIFLSDFGTSTRELARLRRKGAWMRAELLLNQMRRTPTNYPLLIGEFREQVEIARCTLEDIDTTEHELRQISALKEVTLERVAEMGTEFAKSLHPTT